MSGEHSVVSATSLILEWQLLTEHIPPSDKSSRLQVKSERGLGALLVARGPQQCSLAFTKCAVKGVGESVVPAPACSWLSPVLMRETTSSLLLLLLRHSGRMESE